uniref:DUF1618 domain-containing protein n=1 Tax=Aegilops tauschii subsp. strangulata TaxID=200361 RepID=A0A452ZBR4_AEGTS
SMGDGGPGHPDEEVRGERLLLLRPGARRLLRHHPHLRPGLHVEASPGRPRVLRHAPQPRPRRQRPRLPPPRHPQVPLQGSPALGPGPPRRGAPQGRPFGAPLPQVHALRLQPRLRPAVPPPGVRGSGEDLVVYRRHGGHGPPHPSRRRWSQPRAQEGETEMEQLVQRRHMGVSAGRLRYAEIDPLHIRSFVLDDDQSGRWTLEHQVSVPDLWRNGGNAKATPSIAAIDPLDNDALHLSVDKIHVSLDMLGRTITKSSVCTDESQMASGSYLPCVLPSFLWSSPIPEARTKLWTWRKTRLWQMFWFVQTDSKRNEGFLRLTMK